MRDLQGEHPAQMLGYEIYNNPEELGQRLHVFANENRELLMARGLIGFVNRYGAGLEVSTEEGLRIASKSADKAIHDNTHGISGHYLRFDDEGIIDGVGSIQVGLPLRKPTIPLAPAYLGRRVPFMSRDIAVGGVNVSAITRYDKTDGTQLSNCYKFLLEKTASWIGRDVSNDGEYSAWTLVPKSRFSANGEVVGAIIRTGMTYDSQARFDELETWGVPTISRLYTKTLRIS